MSEMKQIDQLWILPTEAGYKIGLTAEAQEDLGKITFATFPKVGQTLAKGDSLIELEAEKAVSEFSSPLSGKVVAINEAADQENLKIFSLTLTRPMFIAIIFSI